MAIDGGIIDFQILEPGRAVAGIFISLVSLLGPLIVWAEKLMDSRLSHGDHWTRLWPGVVLRGAFPALVVVVTLLDSDCAYLRRPIVAGTTLIMLAVFTVVTWVREFRGAHLSYRWNALGRTLFQLAVVTGLIHLGREVAHFV